MISQGGSAAAKIPETSAASSALGAGGVIAIWTSSISVVALAESFSGVKLTDWTAVWGIAWARIASGSVASISFAHGVVTDESELFRPEAASAIRLARISSSL